jgi:hypothetical protein
VSDDERLVDMTNRLRDALGDRLVALVLYGPGAHGDAYHAVGDRHLLVVLADLEPPTLRRLSEPVRWWVGSKRQPWPRLFSADLIREAADVFPIELLDIARHHRVLHGADPFAALSVDRANLRLQCERELREKLMRLREGYVECDGRPHALRELLAVSYASFAAIFRGCLELARLDAPARDHDVVAALCARLSLDAAPFAEVERVAREGGASDPDALFARYYRELSRAVTQIDRFVHEHEAEGS